jgi:hypothetical protein
MVDRFVPIVVAFTPVYPMRVIAALFGGVVVGGESGGLSVSSGEPPAHAIEGVSALPGVRSIRSVGSEITVRSASVKTATLELRGRRRLISASPSAKAVKGGRSTSRDPARWAGVRNPFVNSRISGGIPRGNA